MHVCVRACVRACVRVRMPKRCVYVFRVIACVLEDSVLRGCKMCMCVGEGTLREAYGRDTLMLKEALYS